jgi:hypothetical protein
MPLARNGEHSSNIVSLSFLMAMCSPSSIQATPELGSCHGCAAMAGSAQSTRGGHRRKLHKRPSSNQLRSNAGQAREGPWRVATSPLRSDLAPPDTKYRAACTIQAASSRILHTQLRCGGGGAFDPVRHCSLLAESKMRGR